MAATIQGQLHLVLYSHGGNALGRRPAPCTGVVALGRAHEDLSFIELDRTISNPDGDFQLQIPSFFETRMRDCRDWAVRLDVVHDEYLEWPETILTSFKQLNWVEIQGQDVDADLPDRVRHVLDQVQRIPKDDPALTLYWGSPVLAPRAYGIYHWLCRAGRTSGRCRAILRSYSNHPDPHVSSLVSEVLPAILD